MKACQVQMLANPTGSRTAKREQGAGRLLGRLAMGCFVVCVATLADGATVFYVAPPPAGDDANNGLSAAAPKATLAAAVTAASADDTISVADGTYTLGATVVVNKKLLIRGASGDRDAVIVDGNNAVRCFNFTKDATVENMTITRGRNNPNDYNGSAFYVNISSGAGPTLRNCLIIGNTSTQGGGAGRVDGPLLMDSCSIVGNTAISPGEGAGLHGERAYTAITVTNCLFSSNSSGTTGGAINLENGTLSVSDCMFTNNSAVSGGGAIRISKPLPVSIHRSTFVTNYVSGNGHGGALYMQQDTVATDCLFTNNHVTASGYHGGAVMMYGGTVSGCTILDNRALNGDGGGISTYGTINGTIVITNCLVSDNAAARSGGGICLSGAPSMVLGCTISGNRAAAAHAGAGVFMGKKSPFTIERCAIVGNSASPAGAQGGGLFVNEGATALVRNCLIAGNESVDAGGGCKFYRGPSVVLENCTITGNASAGSNGGGISMDNYGLRNAFTNTIVYGNHVASGVSSNYSNAADATWDHCCAAPAVAGTANTDLAPQFVDAGAGVGLALMGAPFDFGLTKTSPCKDAGTNLAWSSDATDLAGNARLSNGVVDIGAYEYWPPPSLGTIITVR